VCGEWAVSRWEGGRGAGQPAAARVRAWAGPGTAGSVRVSCLVRLLGVGGALGHDDEGGAGGGAGHSGDVVALLPALHDPVLGEELGGQVEHLRREARPGVHDEGPELLAAGHARQVEAVVVALLHVLRHARAGDVVVVALLHGLAGVVDGDPLLGREAEADLLLGQDHLLLGLEVARALLADLLEALEEDGAVGARLGELEEPHPEHGVLWLLVKLGVDDGLSELLEGRGAVAAELVGGRLHLLLADEVALVVPLVPLPREPPPEQEEERVGQRLEVVPARRRAAQVRVHRRVAHRAPEHVGALVVLDVLPAQRVPPARRQPEVHQEQPLLVLRVRQPEQEVLRLDVPVHEACAVRGGGCRGGQGRAGRCAGPREGGGKRARECNKLCRNQRGRGRPGAPPSRQVQRGWSRHSRPGRGCRERERGVRRRHGVVRVGGGGSLTLAVQCLEDAERLDGDAGDHLLRHGLALGVPDVPEGGAEHVHHHDVVVALRGRGRRTHASRPTPAGRGAGRLPGRGAGAWPGREGGWVGGPRGTRLAPLVVDLRDAVDAPQGRVHGPFVGGVSERAPLATPVLELERHQVGVGAAVLLRGRGGGGGRSAQRGPGAPGRR